MKLLRAAVLGTLLAPPVAADESFFQFSSDYLQALHLGHWAEQVVVVGDRPLASLVLAIHEQGQKVNEARRILARHKNDPSAAVRKTVEGLLGGMELFSLTAAEDIADINGMNTRGALTKRLDARTEQRRQAVEVMAASVDFFRVALYERAEGGTAARVPRLTREEADSLWKQTNFFFGESLAGGGAKRSPLLEAVLGLRRALRQAFEDVSASGQKP